MVETFALKSLNQYRKRDIVAYLALRYYLDSASSKTDDWAQKVSVSLTINSKRDNLFKVKHFKKLVQGNLVYRDIHILSPNDMLSESVLISECSKFETFSSDPTVYSYLFSDNKSLIFDHYINGWNKRVNSIKESCLKKPNDEVLYLDIKSFYPSIPLVKLENLWNEKCEEAKIHEKYKRLGLSLINKFKVAQSDTINPGLIVGPMFSHLLANLYLDSVDREMNRLTKNKYWRYVDDVVFIGDSNEISLYKNRFNELLLEKGLETHEESKIYHTTANEWLDSIADVDRSVYKRWPKIVGSIKRYLILYPNDIENLRTRISQTGARLNIPEMFAESKSKSLSERIRFWFDRAISTQDQRVIEIIREIQESKKIYINLFDSLIGQTSNNVVGQKSLHSMLKYLYGRMIYLCNKSELESLQLKISSIEELIVQYEITNAIINNDISNIVKFGTNVAQAVAQVLKVNADAVFCSVKDYTEEVILSLAIFKFHGIEVLFEKDIDFSDPLYNFALGEIRKAIESKNPFIDEVASLHGINETRHSTMLSSLIDEDEFLSFDVLNAEGSSYV